jgi:hypothetical protein
MRLGAERFIDGDTMWSSPEFNMSVKVKLERSQLCTRDLSLWQSEVTLTSGYEHEDFKRSREGVQQEEQLGGRIRDEFRKRERWRLGFGGGNSSDNSNSSDTNSDASVSDSEKRVSEFASSVEAIVGENNSGLKDFAADHLLTLMPSTENNDRDSALSPESLGYRAAAVSMKEAGLGEKNLPELAGPAGKSLPELQESARPTQQLPFIEPRNRHRADIHAPVFALDLQDVHGRVVAPATANGKSLNIRWLRDFLLYRAMYEPRRVAEVVARWIDGINGSDTNRSHSGKSGSRKVKLVAVPDASYLVSAEHVEVQIEICKKRFGRVHRVEVELLGDANVLLDSESSAGDGESVLDRLKSLAEKLRALVEKSNDLQEFRREIDKTVDTLVSLGLSGEKGNGSLSDFVIEEFGLEGLGSEAVIGSSKNQIALSSSSTPLKLHYLLCLPATCASVDAWEPRYGVRLIETLHANQMLARWTANDSANEIDKDGTTTTTATATENPLVPELSRWILEKILRLQKAAWIRQRLEEIDQAGDKVAIGRYVAMSNTMDAEGAKMNLAKMDISKIKSHSESDPAGTRSTHQLENRYPKHFYRVTQADVLATISSKNLNDKVHSGNGSKPPPIVRWDDVLAQRNLCYVEDAAVFLPCDEANASSQSQANTNSNSGTSPSMFLPATKILESIVDVVGKRSSAASTRKTLANFLEIFESEVSRLYLDGVDRSRDWPHPFGPICRDRDGLYIKCFDEIRSHSGKNSDGGKNIVNSMANNNGDAKIPPSKKILNFALVVVHDLSQPYTRPTFKGGNRVWTTGKDRIHEALNYWEENSQALQFMMKKENWGDHVNDNGRLNDGNNVNDQLNAEALSEEIEVHLDCVLLVPVEEDAKFSDSLGEQFYSELEENLKSYEFESDSSGSQNVNELNSEEGDKPKKPSPIAHIQNHLGRSHFRTHFRVVRYPMKERILDKLHPTHFNVTEPTVGNVYPLGISEHLRLGLVDLVCHHSDSGDPREANFDEDTYYSDPRIQIPLAESKCYDSLLYTDHDFKIFRPDKLQSMMVRMYKGVDSERHLSAAEFDKVRKGKQNLNLAENENAKTNSALLDQNENDKNANAVSLNNIFQIPAFPNPVMTAVIGLGRMTKEKRENIFSILKHTAVSPNGLQIGQMGPRTESDLALGKGEYSKAPNERNHNDHDSLIRFH